LGQCVARSEPGSRLFQKLVSAGGLSLKVKHVDLGEEHLQSLRVALARRGCKSLQETDRPFARRFPALRHVFERGVGSPAQMDQDLGETAGADRLSWSELELPRRGRGWGGADAGWRPRARGGAP